MLKRIFLLSSLCLFALSCFAQEGEIKLQFVTFPKLINAEPIELLIGNEETLEVELPTNSLSPVYTVKSLTECVLGRSSEGANGKFAFSTYGRSALLDSPEQLILVIRKGAKESDGFELIPMDSQESGFGGGDYFFMNASMVDIAVEIGKEIVILKPRKHKIVQPKPSKVEGDRKYLYVYIHFRKGKEAVPFYSNTWRFSERARCMVFLYHDPHTKQLRTHTIRNYI